MVERPGFVKTMSAGPRAASVAPPTTIPTFGMRQGAGHGTQMAKTLETFDDFELVLREDTTVRRKRERRSNSSTIPLLYCKSRVHYWNKKEILRITSDEGLVGNVR
jgi:hypothetical protein